MNNTTQEPPRQMPRITSLPRPGRPVQDAKAAVPLAEVFAVDAGAVGFVLAQLPGAGAPVLWLQDRMSRRETGRPHLPGLGGRSLLLLDMARAADVLIAAEEGLRCKALSGVVAEMWGDPPALSFTATKRLVLRAEASGLPCWLIRHGGTPDLSAARDRWRIAARPSAPNPDDARAPGDPCWQAELFRSRDKNPGTWAVRYDRAAARTIFTAAPADEAIHAAPQAARARG